MFYTDNVSELAAPHAEAAALADEQEHIDHESATALEVAEEETEDENGDLWEAGRLGPRACAGGKDEGEDEEDKEEEELDEFEEEEEDLEEEEENEEVEKEGGFDDLDEELDEEEEEEG